MGRSIGGSISAKNLHLYPDMPSWQRPYVYGDIFSRGTLNAPNTLTLYNTSFTGAGSAAININPIRLLLTTAAVAGDDASVRLGEYHCRRLFGWNSNGYFSQNTTEINVIFALPLATLTEGFIGVDQSGGALTVLPTTAVHAGIFWDASAQANFRFTSADGTTQANNDTTQALSTANFRMRILWTGDDAAEITLFSGTLGAGFDTQIATQAVTALNSTDNQFFQLQFFVQTETTAARNLSINEWYVEGR